MLRLRSVGSNMTELDVGGHTVLFSYETPVAAFVQKVGYIRTDKHYSSTTTRHINKWLDGIGAEVVSQSEIDSLVE